MDVLIPVLVAILLAETGGRVQVRAQALGLRFPDRTGAILSALALTSLVSLIVAAIGGAFVAELIDFRARNLLSGLALAFAGVPMLFALKPATPPAGTTPFAAGLRAFGPIQFGDASQFIVFAFAARGDLPAFAVTGGLAAVLAAASLPLLAKEDWPAPASLTVVRRIAGVLLILWGGVFAASAFRVI